jgi:hypothetical protein
LRNYIFLHALENDLPLPIGTQDLGLLDTRTNDEDVDQTDFIDDPNVDEALDEMVDEEAQNGQLRNGGLRTEARFRQRAAEIYQAYRQNYLTRFKC